MKNTKFLSATARTLLLLSSLLFSPNDNFIRHLVAHKTTKEISVFRARSSQFVPHFWSRLNTTTKNTKKIRKITKSTHLSTAISNHLSLLSAHLHTSSPSLIRISHPRLSQTLDAPPLHIFSRRTSVLDTQFSDYQGLTPRIPTRKPLA